MRSSGELTRLIHEIVARYPELPMPVAARLIQLRQRSYGMPARNMGPLWAAAEKAIHSVPADAPFRSTLIEMWDGTAAARAEAGHRPPERGMTVDHSEQINEIAAALAKAQGAMANASKNRENEHFRSSYADLAAVLDACRGPLSAHGLAVVQATRTDESGGVTLDTMLLHASGQWFRGSYPIRPVKADPQGFGSAISYARRYCLMAIVGLASDDDDGNAASEPAARDKARGNGKREDRPGRPESRREAPNGPARPAAASGNAPGTGDDRHAWSAAELGPYIDAWHEFAPIADGKERTAREHRMVQGMISAAIADELVREPKVCKPAEAGKAPARDPAKCWGAAKWLRETQPDWFRLFLENYVEEKRANAAAAGADPSPPGAAPQRKPPAGGGASSSPAGRQYPTLLRPQDLRPQPATSIGPAPQVYHRCPRNQA